MPKRVMLLGRSGGDLRWSYCEGDANDAHNLAPCDVRRVRDAFKALEYDEIVVLKATADEGEIVNRLNACTRSTASGDTFIFYFSGHTRMRRGKLQLVLGADDGQEQTLSATTLIEKIEDSKASTKLIILDCCYAGEATTDWKPEIHENLRILAASDRASPAGEFDELEGSVFSYFLYQALTNRDFWIDDRTGVVDEDGVIWSDILSRWLKVRVTKYAQAAGRTVGEPLEYVGSDKQRVRLAQIAPLDRSSSLVARLRSVDLRACLEVSGLSAARERALFDDLLDKIQPDYDDEPRPDATASLGRLLDYLADMGVRAANVPVALLEFAELIAGEAGNGQQVRDWIGRVGRALEQAGELSGAQRAALGSSRGFKSAREVDALDLMVVPGQRDAQTGRFANAGAWLAVSGAVPVCVAARDREIGPEDIADLIGDALNDQRVTSRLMQANDGIHLTLELFLPRELLLVDADDWTPWEMDPDVPVPPLSYHYNLVVRPWGRIAPEPERCWTQGWAQGWGLCSDCRSHELGDLRCVAWLDGAVRDYGARLGRGACLFILRSPLQDRADLVRPLVHGVAKLLWCDETIAEDGDLERLLLEKAEGRTLGDLPDIVRRTRMDRWEETGEDHTGRLHLLWDDPGRQPPIWQDPGKASVGTAFAGRKVGESYYPRVLLIDEIDKSDIDLPNDLLHIFEEGEFEIPELKRDSLPEHEVAPWDSGEPLTIEHGLLQCRAFPIVVMTINGEREFPPAFLRRLFRLIVPCQTPRGTHPGGRSTTASRLNILPRVRHGEPP